MENGSEKARQDGFWIGFGFAMSIVVLMIIGLLAGATCANAGEIVEHLCGQGEHTVRVRVGTKSVCEDPKLTLNLDDSYVQAEPVCHDEPDIASQRWSDWPECPDAERLSETLFIRGDSTWATPLSSTVTLGNPQ